MTYILQAIITKKGLLVNKPAEDMFVVFLEQEYEMLPFTNAFIDTHQIAVLPVVGDDAEVLPESIAKLCAVLSAKSVLAYVEAEFFGGVGMQASAVFKDGQMVDALVIGESAINHALKRLGVIKGTQLDEFEAIGLNRHRDTGEWIGSM